MFMSGSVAILLMTPTLKVFRICFFFTPTPKLVLPEAVHFIACLFSVIMQSRTTLTDMPRMTIAFLYINIKD